MRITTPGIAWHPCDAEKKLAVLNAIHHGNKRYTAILKFVKNENNINSKITLNLYLKKLEDEKWIRRNKISHKRVEYEFIGSDEQLKDTQKKLQLYGASDFMKRGHPYLIDISEKIGRPSGEFESLQSLSLPKWFDEIDLLKIGIVQDQSHIPYQDFPAFSLITGKEFEGKTVSEIDEQLILYDLPHLRDALFLKFMEISARLNHANENDKQEWLKKALGFEALITFRLNGKMLLEAIAKYNDQKAIERALMSPSGSP
jgi:DNA-binding HxlR family transcriptional regulator